MNTGKTVGLETKAEAYTPKAIDEIKLIGRVRNALKVMVEETDKVAGGDKIFYAVYVEGLYGSGKTLLMRKYCNKVFEEFEKVIPIYVYLGEQDFLPFTILENYCGAVESFVNQGMPAPPVVGEPGLWEGRLKVLKDAINDAKDLTQDELEKFYHALKAINKQGYYPVVVFDEFERVLYTGEGLRTDGAKKNFANFSKGYLELVRGHRYQGVFILVTTFRLSHLLRKAIDLGYPHLDELSRYLGLDLKRRPEQFPMVAVHVEQSYDERTEVSWSPTELDLLAREYDLLVDKDVISIVARVLPTPRAIINITREARKLRIEGVINKQKFIEVVRLRYESFKDELLREKVDGKFIIQPQTKWHEVFERLLEKGILEITSREKYLEVAEAIGIKFDKSQEESVKKAKRKASELLRKLSNLSLYEARGGGMYILNQYLLAYLLGVDRLPGGEEATLERIIGEIKSRIKKRRKESS